MATERVSWRGDVRLHFGIFLSLHELSHCLVGSLLGVPTHTVNVTTLQSTHDIWDSYAMSPYEVCSSSPGHTTVHNFSQELSTRTLSQFLLENEGKRCVVVLDVWAGSLS